MNRTILVKIHNGDESVVILEDGILVEYMHRKDGEIARGSVLMAEVKEYQKSLDAYFLNIGASNPGYMPGKFLDENINIGRIIPLQVVKPQTKQKGMTLSAWISISGKYCVILSQSGKCRISSKIVDEKEYNRLKILAQLNCPENRGIIIRTNAVGVSDEYIKEDIIKTNELFTKVISSGGSPGEVVYLPKGITDDAMRKFNPENDIVYFNNMDIFNKYFKEYAVPGQPSSVKYYDKDYEMFSFFGISNKIDEAGRRRVWLKSGGTLVFDYTEAMCVIDVNTSKNTRSGNFKDTVLKTNMEAAAEIATQIRLRNIGGIIIIDFIEMNEADNDKLDKVFRKHLARDNKKMTVGGFTALGNYELTRIRKGKRLEINDD